MTVNLGSYLQLAVAIIGNIDSHNMVCPVVIQARGLNIPKPCCLVLDGPIGNRFLNRELIVLAIVCLGERMPRKLRHYIGNAIGAVVFVGELLVCIGK